MNHDNVIKKRFSINDKGSLPFIGRRKYSRNDLSVLFKDLGFSIGAEIGVLEGCFSKVLFDNIPGLKLICVDAWMDYVKIGGDKLFKVATNNLKNYNAELKRMLSYDAAKTVDDESLDFIYIDADHRFDGVIVDLVEWSKKVRPGGIISGHDYHVNCGYGVITAVDSYTRAHNISDYYITREGKPSFFWVKK